MTDQEYVLTPGEAAQPASTGIRQKLEGYFGMAARGSSVRQETLAGITTFLTMVYSVFVVPGMFGEAGFDKSAVFIAVCLTSAFGSILMGLRSEEHTSELQSLMRISYAVFCLKTKKNQQV